MRPATRPLAFTALLAVALALFVSHAERDALSAWFANDDFLWLDRSRPSDVAASFVEPWGFGAAYRPMARVSFLVDALVFGQHAAAWHATNLALHVAAATLLGVLVLRLSDDAPLAAASALVFALLPLGDEVVVWISGRICSLGLVLVLGALIALDSFVETPSRARLAAALALALAALLVHEGCAVVVPLATALAAFRWHTGAARRSVAASLLGIAVVAAAYLALRAFAIGTRVLYAARPAAHYGALEAIAEWFLTQVQPSPGIFVAALAAGALVVRRTFWAGCAGIAGGLLAFAPFAAVDNFGLRYLYASGAGLAVALAAAVMALTRVPWLGKPAAAVLLFSLLRSEWAGAAMVAREWREAGALSRATLAIVVLDPPLMHGRGMMLHNFFESALRRFEPGVRATAIPGHYLTRFPPELGVQLAAQSWRREQEARAAAGLPPSCGWWAGPRARRPRRILRTILACDPLFLAVHEDTGEVAILDRAAAEIRLEPVLRWLADPDRPPRGGQRGHDAGRGDARARRRRNRSAGE